VAWNVTVVITYAKQGRVVYKCVGSLADTLRKLLGHQRPHGVVVGLIHAIDWVTRLRLKPDVRNSGEGAWIR
jgi:hypothetical protein